MKYLFHFKYFDLLKALVVRDISARYKGSLFGIFWAFLNPCFMLALYSFVFGFVFTARWGDAAHLHESNFTLILFLGLIVHGAFGEVVLRSASLIGENVNYVKKIVFPLRMLSVVIVASSMINAMIGYFVFLFFYIIFVGVPPIQVLFTPIIFFVFTPFLLACSWFLSAIGAYIKDLNQILGTIVTGMLFMSPVLYPVSALPISIQKLIYANPLTFPIEQLRELSIFSDGIDFFGLVIYGAASVVMMFLAAKFFNKLSDGFSDVL